MPTKRDCVAVLVLLGLPLTFMAIAWNLAIVHRLDPEELQAEKARSWAGMGWDLGNCAVESVGVAYRGTCPTDVLWQHSSRQDFAECDGPSEKQTNFSEARASSPAGICDARANSLYRARHDAENHAEQVPASRRLLPQMRPPQRKHCYNDYVPWAIVWLSNGTAGGARRRCAYTHGASRPSIVHEWAAVNQVLAHLTAQLQSDGAECWVLRADDCVVALDHHSGRTALDSSGELFVWSTNLVCGAFALSVLVCCCLAVCSEVCDSSCGWIRVEVDRLLFGRSGGEHQRLPHEDPEAPLSLRAKQIVAAAAQQLQDATPLSSGVRSGNGREARNIAADFLLQRTPGV